MSQSAADATRCRLPRTFTGKGGLPIELCRLPGHDGERLIEMYLAYQPRNSFQGLPPLKDEACVRWVRDMLATGSHIVATPSRSAGVSPGPKAADGTPAIRKDIIGHCGLFRVNDKKCELLVVVCPGFQNLGIGTELVRSCVALADELGFERIWLPVDATNVRARHVYCKCGFEYVSNKQGHELDMICDVRSQRPHPVYELHAPATRVPAPCFRVPSLSPSAEGK
jgi:RimJ/RimL family protein N-acetyltransferase